MTDHLTDTLEELASRCAGGGLDLLAPLQAGWYNEQVPPQHRLPDFGRARSLTILVGATRRLWTHFVAALVAEPWRIEQPDPLETYVAEAVTRALAAQPEACQTRFSHRPEPEHIAFQRLAHVAGMAHLGPSSLSVHPRYGPWISLRAAIVFDLDGPGVRPPELPNPCGDCSGRCLVQLERARRASGASMPRDARVRSHWRSWLAIRDACPVGREHRYSDDQIRYHYTKDKRTLRALVGRAGAAAHTRASADPESC